MLDYMVGSDKHIIAMIYPTSRAQYAAEYY